MASPLKPPMQCPNNLQFPDSRPRACSHRSLFVRRTPTRPRAKGQEPHFTQRLVRCGSRVRQRTLRNLGRHVALPRGGWPALCARVERILAPQRSLELGACCPAVEDEAQRSAAQLVQAGVSPVGPAAPADGADDPSAALPRVDVDSLELVRPRSVGVERVALWAMRQLRPPSLLEELGLSGAQRAAVLGNLVGRMAAPASERAAWHWLRQRSALDELLGCDCETMGRNALQPTVTLHDLTRTCFEGAADRQRVFDESRAVAIGTAGGQRALACAETDGNGETRLRTTRRVEKVRQRIGRLQARHPSAAPHCAIDVQADDRGRNATAVAWKRQPLEGSGATHPGVHGLRTHSVGRDAERLWRTCVTPTDLEAVLRSLGSALGPRPIHHRRPARKATQAESWQREIHERLGVDASPGGVRKLLVQPQTTKEKCTECSATRLIR